MRKISQFKNIVFHHDTTSISQSKNYGHAMKELWYVNTEANFVQRGENSLIVKGDTSCAKHD